MLVERAPAWIKNAAPPHGVYVKCCSWPCEAQTYAEWSIARICNFRMLAKVDKTNVAERHTMSYKCCLYFAYDCLFTVVDLLEIPKRLPWIFSMLYNVSSPSAPRSYTNQSIYIYIYAHLSPNLRNVRGKFMLLPCLLPFRPMSIIPTVSPPSSMFRSCAPSLPTSFRLNLVLYTRSFICRLTP